MLLSPAPDPPLRAHNWNVPGHDANRSIGFQNGVLHLHDILHAVLSHRHQNVIRADPLVSQVLCNQMAIIDEQRRITQHIAAKDLVARRER